MKRLRFWCTALFAWFFIFYNIERLHEPINLASFIYVFAPAVALPVVLFPRLQPIRLRWLVLAPVPFVLALKWWLGYAIGGAALPITMTELGAVWTTIVMSYRIGDAFEELRTSIAYTLVHHLDDGSRPFEDGQGEIYREIRRARAFKRQLTLLTIAATEQTQRATLDRFTTEVQRDMVDHYMRARLASFLATQMKEHDIITHSNGHFVAVLPETTREHASEVVDRLQRTTRERLGLDLKVGISVFPEDEITFVKLLERAQDHMQSAPNAEAARPSGETLAAEIAHDQLSQGQSPPQDSADSTIATHAGSTH